VFGRRYICFLPRLASRHQDEFGQIERVGETSCQRKVAVVDRVERAPEYADAPAQRPSFDGGPGDGPGDGL